jgi:hypothetical protein
MRPCTSLNHFVRTRQELRGNLDTKRRRGLQIDHQLERGRLLDREVCGLCFLQDLVDVDRGEAEALGSISV